MIEFTLTPLSKKYILMLVPIALVLLKCAVYLLTRRSKNRAAVRISEFIQDNFTMVCGHWTYEFFHIMACLFAGLFILTVVCYYPLRSMNVSKFKKFEAYKERIESREVLSHEILLQAEKYNVWMEDTIDGYNSNFMVKGYDFKPIDMKMLWEKHGRNKCCAMFEELRDK